MFIESEKVVENCVCILIIYTFVYVTDTFNMILICNSSTFKREAYFLYSCARHVVSFSSMRLFFQCCYETVLVCEERITYYGSKSLNWVRSGLVREAIGYNYPH